MLRSGKLEREGHCQKPRAVKRWEENESFPEALPYSTVIMSMGMVLSHEEKDDIPFNTFFSDRKKIKF